MTLQDALAVTTANINNEISDILAKENYLYQKLDKMKVFKDGGLNFQIPIANQESNQKGFIAGTNDVINLSPNTVLTYGTLNWKNFYYGVSIELMDMVTTSDSSDAVVSLVLAKKAQALNSAVRDLSSGFYGSAANNVLLFNGFADIFAASGTAYAGLNNSSANLSNWFYLLDTALTGGSAINLLTYNYLAKMITTLNARSGQMPVDKTINSNYKVDLILANPAVYSQYCAQMQVQQRYYADDIAKTGFEYVKVNNVDFTSDPFSPGSGDGTTADNFCYVLSMASIQLWYKYWFDKPSPIDYKGMTIPNQPLASTVQYLSGNLVCTNRRVNGVFKTLVA